MSDFRSPTPDDELRKEQCLSNVPFLKPLRLSRSQPPVSIGDAEASRSDQHQFHGPPASARKLAQRGSEWNRYRMKDLWEDRRLAPVRATGKKQPRRRALTCH